MERDDWKTNGLSQNNDNTTGTSSMDEERIRIEFYATYDVMTGVRIAYTLGGFFALMVFLIVYKSRSKSLKALNDPKLVELAEAVVAEEQAFEEELQLTAALEDALAERALSRPSISEAPPWPRSSRFASYGGYGNVRAHPRRLSSIRGDSLPTSVLRYCDRRMSSGTRNRRFSSVTCSSSGSSYLDRRPSSVMCALSEVRNSQLLNKRLAPLASVSVGPSYAMEYEIASMGPDSVFVDIDADSTDDEIEQFSTDSGGGGEVPANLEIRELTSNPETHPQKYERASLSRETLF